MSVNQRVKQQKPGEADTEAYLGHHKRLKYCTTRLKYRQGRHLKAVKVYTVGNESQNLLVFGVPKINLYQELKRKLQRYGSVEHIRNITTEWVERPNAEPLEAFTEVFSVKYRKPEQARFCKHYMDAKEFYGGILHISYAPENETVDELRSKLLRRQFEINQRLDINQRQKRALNKAAKKATTGSIFTCTLTPATINFSKNKHPRKTFKS